MRSFQIAQLLCLIGILIALVSIRQAMPPTWREYRAAPLAERSEMLGRRAMVFAEIDEPITVTISDPVTIEEPLDVRVTNLGEMPYGR